jgi:hypothetical protein
LWLVGRNPPAEPLKVHATLFRKGDRGFVRMQRFEDGVEIEAQILSAVMA